MDTKESDWLTAHKACKSGDIDTVRSYFEATPSPISSPQTDSSTSPSPASPRRLILNRTSITSILIAACEGNQSSTFAYIWDEIITPHEPTPIPWPCLKAAAHHGSILLAQELWARDPDCFKTTEPPAIRGYQRDGHQQFNIAIRNDNYDYIDFMIAHGGDLNAGLEGDNDILKMVVNCAVEDEVTMRRVRFLVDRGVKIEESMALREAVRGGAVELVKLLLECGADLKAVPTPQAMSSLAIAGEEGYKEIVDILLNYEARSHGWKEQEERVRVGIE